MPVIISSKLYTEQKKKLFELLLMQNNLSKIGSMEISLEVGQDKNMAKNEQQIISGYEQPNMERLGSSIVRPSVATNNFKLKPKLI